MKMGMLNKGMPKNGNEKTEAMGKGTPGRGRASKSLSLLLALLMALSLLPMGLFAGGAADPGEPEGESAIAELSAIGQESENEATDENLSDGSESRFDEASGMDEEACFACTEGLTALGADVTDGAIFTSLEAILPMAAPFGDMLSEVEAAIETLTNNHFYLTDSEWGAAALIRGGVNINDIAGKTILERYRGWFGKDGVPIMDYERAAIVLTAMGVDARHTYSGEEGRYLDFIGKITDRESATLLNDMVFTLIALDSGMYPDEDVTLKRDVIIGSILDLAFKPGGGWALIGTTPDVDMTAIVIYGLAPYYNDREDVRIALDRAVEVLSKAQQDDGRIFSGSTSGGSDSISQTIVALSSLGIDGHTDPRFVKSGGSLLEALFRYRTDDGRFGNSGNTGANAKSTENALNALTAYRGFRNDEDGEGCFHLYRFGGPPTGSGIELTGEADPEKPVDSAAPKNVTVRVENLYTGKTMIPATAVLAAGKHIDALKAALTVHEYDPEQDMLIAGGYLTTLLGYSYNWMYSLNGISSSVGIDEMDLRENDEIVLFYSENEYLPPDYAPTEQTFLGAFDPTSITVGPGEQMTITLTGYDGNLWYAPPAVAIGGATVYVLDASGERLGSAITDAQGKATLTFPTEGDFTIRAEKPGVINANVIVSPICTVAVGNRVTVRIEDLVSGTTKMKETAVSVRGTLYDALVAALLANHTNPDVLNYTSDYGGYINSIYGLRDGWMYAVNGETIWDPIAVTLAQDGDEIVFYNFVYDPMESVMLSYFDQRDIVIMRGEQIALTLTALVTDWDTYTSSIEPVVDGIVYALSAAGAVVGEATTDENGVASLTFVSSGIYTISARKPGASNANTLVPPLCTVRVTAPNDGSVNPDGISVTIRVQGDSARGTIVGSTSVTIDKDANAFDLLREVLDERGLGYSFNMKTGYVESVDGLSEFDNGPQSGWMIRVNNQLIREGSETFRLNDGDSILWFYSNDWTKEPDALFFGSGSADEEAAVAEVNVNASVSGGGALASAAISTLAIQDALQSALDKLNQSPDLQAAEVKLVVSAPINTPKVQVEIKASDIQSIVNAQDVRLTIESGVASFTFASQTLAGIIQGAAGGAAVKFGAEKVDASSLSPEAQAVVGDSPVYDLSLMVGDNVIHNLYGEATVFLPYAPAAGTDPATLTVYWLDENNAPVPMEGVYYDAERGGYVFTTNHFSLFFIAAGVSGVTSVSGGWANPFADVKPGDWFYDVVGFVYGKGLMTGTAKDTFAPELSLTRAMLVAVLHRMEGSLADRIPAAAGGGQFADVPEGQWFSAPVDWAASNGVVAGYGDGRFGPDDSITREQFAAILHNYAGMKQYDVSGRADLSAFGDASQVSEWAAEAVAWANGAGLVAGRTLTTLAPLGEATRAEAAAILERFIGAYAQ
ncbi:MAG: S-layer homology domain-containing protein [Clostridiales bacterium]|nr:S-layer homology domain-containing protein [Clostridiales bacterium]